MNLRGSSVKNVLLSEGTKQRGAAVLTYSIIQGKRRSFAIGCQWNLEMIHLQEQGLSGRTVTFFTDIWTCWDLAFCHPFDAKLS